MFLLVQNPGVAPVEGFTLLGVSTTRDCGVEGAIGQFGSGNKHAINVLLRAGLKVIVYCGKTRLDFQTRDDEIDDGLIRKPVKRVMCKLGGTSTRTIDLGWVLDFGAIDWTELGMALREFVSNAIDRTLRQENGEFIPAMLDGRLAVVPVCDEKVKAKDGYTRVYVELNAGVQRYVDDLPKRFLHFSADPSQVKKSFLPKGDRNLNGKKTAVIYRAGVFVREIEENSDESVYDYNFKQDELQIDECRNASDYTVKAAIAKLYRRATAPELTPVFRALVDAEAGLRGQPGPALHLLVVGHARSRAAAGVADGVAGRGGGCRHVRPLGLDCRLRGEEGLRCQDHQCPGHRAGRQPLRHQDRWPGLVGEREERPREDPGHRGGPGRRGRGVALADEIQPDGWRGEARGRLLP